MKQRLLILLLLIGFELDEKHAKGIDDTRNLENAYNLLLGIIEYFD